MCGRYASSASQELLEDTFELDEVVELPAPSWNVAPTDPVPAVVERPGEAGPVRKLVAPRWGLVPAWSKDATGGARMINARVETVAEKPAFRRALAARRCLLPADGYFEWYRCEQLDRRGKPVKQPYFIRPTAGGLFVMAGLYEFWKAPDGSWLTTCAVITTTATDELGRIHDRMPLVVAREAWTSWLAADHPDPLALLQVPTPQLDAYPVSRAVGQVANNGPELVAPLPPDQVWE